MGKNPQQEKKAHPTHPAVAILLLFSICNALLLVEPGALASVTTRQEPTASLAANEATAIANLKVIQAAQATFQATAGNGRFGRANELGRTKLIEPNLLRMGRSGYRFQLEVEPSGRSFVAVARPIRYGVTGRRSFSINELGVLRFSSQRNAALGMMRPLIDEGGNIAANEASAIAMLRTVYSAQVTYQATRGNGDFASLEALGVEGLLAIPSGGRKNGYLFKILRVERSTPESSSGFEAIATPATYGETGLRSFYLDESGTIRAADRKGMPANSQDEALYK